MTTVAPPVPGSRADLKRCAAEVYAAAENLQFARVRYEIAEIQQTALVVQRLHEWQVTRVEWRTAIARLESAIDAAAQPPLFS